MFPRKAVMDREMLSAERKISSFGNFAVISGEQNNSLNVFLIFVFGKICHLHFSAIRTYEWSKLFLMFLFTMTVYECKLLFFLLLFCCL